MSPPGARADRLELHCSSRVRAGRRLSAKRLDLRAMADSWQEIRWEAAVSDAKSLAMVSLLDHDGLHITVQDLRDPARRRYRFTFHRVPAYRNILEEYRTGEPVAPKGTGWTRVVPESPWLSELRKREPLLDVHSPACEHYVIVTEDDVIDVLSPEPPTIHEVEPGHPDENPPGKSKGCVATGKTIDVALRRIESAIELHVRGLRDDGISVPRPRQRAARPRRTAKQVSFYATVEVAA